MKTTYIMRYDSFEFLVMSFNLTNAPSIFCTMMNQHFKEHLDKSMVVYLDDIMVCNMMLEEHIRHLCIIFEILQKNNLNIKMEKCYFTEKGILFLGH